MLKIRFPLGFPTLRVSDRKISTQTQYVSVRPVDGDGRDAAVAVAFLAANDGKVGEGKKDARSDQG